MQVSDFVRLGRLAGILLHERVRADHPGCSGALKGERLAKTPFSRAIPPGQNFVKRQHGATWVIAASGSAFRPGLEVRPDR